LKITVDNLNLYQLGRVLGILQKLIPELGLRAKQLGRGTESQQERLGSRVTAKSLQAGNKNTGKGDFMGCKNKGKKEKKKAKKSKKPVKGV
jgi:hypothetical protein